MYGVLWTYGDGPQHTADVADVDGAIQLVNALKATGAKAEHWKLREPGTPEETLVFHPDLDRRVTPAQSRLIMARRRGQRSE
jgi:hypothetical protein